MSDRQSTTGRAAAAAVATTLVLALTAGCASTSAADGKSQASSPPPPAPAASRPVSGYHTTAAALARQITGCHPDALTPHTAGQRLHLPDARGVASAASCTLRGRTALVLTFTRAAQAAVEARLRDRVAFYATGPSWSGAPTDTSERVGQQSVVQDVALALGGLVETGG